jgi:hypothetical protein
MPALKWVFHTPARMIAIRDGIVYKVEKTKGSYKESYKITISSEEDDEVFFNGVAFTLREVFRKIEQWEKQ